MLSCILLHPTSPASLDAVSSEKSPTFRTLHFHQAAPLHRAARSGLGMATKKPWLQNDTAGWWNSQAGQDWTIERLFRDVRGAPYFVDRGVGRATQRCARIWRHRHWYPYIATLWLYMDGRGSGRW